MCQAAICSGYGGGQLHQALGTESNRRAKSKPPAFGGLPPFLPEPDEPVGAVGRSLIWAQLIEQCSQGLALGVLRALSHLAILQPEFNDFVRGLQRVSRNVDHARDVASLIAKASSQRPITSTRLIGRLVRERRRPERGRAADTARPAPLLPSCAGYAALLAGAALSTITGVSNQVISGAAPKAFATYSRHSVL